MKIQKVPRSFVQENLQVDSWAKIEGYYQNLTHRKIETLPDFTEWLKDKSELEAVLEEDCAWRYIHMTIDTKNEEYSKAYSFFVAEIQPKMAPYEDLLNNIIVENPYSVQLETESAYKIYFKSVRRALELYRKENIAIEADINERSQLFGSISGAQSIEHEGSTLTMQKASSLLKETNEELRKEVFLKMAARRSDDIDQLDDLFSELVQKRNQVALNAGFSNFRDYKLAELCRFDYTKEDCFDFHKAIKKHIVPIVKDIQQKHKDKLNKESLKPWDLEVDPEGKAPLKPFTDGKELLEGSLKMFSKMDTYFKECLETMAEMNHLDLDSKSGKAPGGYNYPLYEIGVPFIFMNAVGSQRDLVTMIHEGGHAVHSFLSRDLPLTAFKNLPSEVAELASMSMELLSMNQWDTFYSDLEELKRAKREQLETILKILPWIATIDEFQHWIYENPNHTPAERTKQWEKLGKDYGTGLVDWTGYETVKATSWQRQMHLFEVPFYYIEYGIAQLGALSVWKNSKSDFPLTISKYKEALKLGYTQSIPEIYATAGIKFDFSDAYLKDLAGFVQDELTALQD
jgi:oligoendopeptidase F